MEDFDHLGLSPGLVKAVTLIGFERPTPIQAKAIPILLKGDQDFVGLAQTGTGKTAAFGLPLLELVDESSKITQALVLAPTRELSLQITQDLENFAEPFKRLNIVAVYGGSSISEQIRRVKRGAQIIVATPGRLIDLINRNVIKLETVKIVVMDEADEMLNMGFKEDIDTILEHTPSDKITWLFSATMAKDVKRISKQYMSNPYELTIGAENAAAANIEHRYVLVSEKDKYLALKRLLDASPAIFGLVFCRTRIDTQSVAEMLIKDGYSADALHGDLTQQQRDRVMQKFRGRSIQILVATDVAARGIDVDDITHVIHMNMPDEMDFYTHRSGRTARAGKSGISIAMVTRRGLGRVHQLEKSIKLPFKRMMIPTGKDVCQIQLLKLIHRVHEVKINEKEIASFLPAIFEELDGLSREDIIKRFASIEFNRFLEYYRDAPDLNVSEKSERSSSKERYTTGDRFFINVGKMDGLDKGGLLNLIDSHSGVRQADIGKIELKGAYSFFEVDKSKTKNIKQLQGQEFQGRRIRLEITEPKKPSRGKSYKSDKRQDKPKKKHRKGVRR
jgi:ATP-dependent RNA helicase DeaD